jgi:hypothetical protein
MGKARVKCLWQMTLLGEVLLYVSVSRREKAWPQVWIRLTVPNSVGERDEQNQNGNCLNITLKGWLDSGCEKDAIRRRVCLADGSLNVSFEHTLDVEILRRVRLRAERSADWRSSG